MPKTAAVTPSAPPPPAGSEAPGDEHVDCPPATATDVIALLADRDAVGPAEMCIGEAAMLAIDRVLLDDRGSEDDGPALPSGSPEAFLNGSLHLVSRTPLGSAADADLVPANVPVAACAAPMSLCPQCGSSKTWRLHGVSTGRFACFA
ncbi:MAG TPA: hypothetical protein VGC99_22150, partial [Candidatus Tectomicrobia bacterium]